jgi:hypothetical protein
LTHGRFFGQTKYNAIISYHINTDEAYSNYSEYTRVDGQNNVTFEDGLVNEVKIIQNNIMNE